ncbi:SLATT domain-containing protein [Ahrensia kielensis]|uniref:SLATT domain-containing protein n=1 Tax=Ahrensia kielensis TaxID=76980 RepID=UPI00035EDA8E|nr:SLATT domain-containing protein [Ahrensia kielensis]
MSDFQKDKILTRIWWTSKIRMQSEKRLRSYDRLAHISVALVSVLLIGLTLYNDTFSDNLHRDEHLITLSVLITVLSLVLLNFKFGEKAVLHRECYLKLQAIADSNIETPLLVSKYHEILASYPNHASSDRTSLIIYTTLFGSGKLTDTNDNDVKWNFAYLFMFLVNLLLPWLAIIIVVGFALFGPFLIRAAIG